MIKDGMGSLSLGKKQQGATAGSVIKKFLKKLSLRADSFLKNMVRASWAEAFRQRYS